MAGVIFNEQRRLMSGGLTLSTGDHEGAQCRLTEFGRNPRPGAGEFAIG
jgi:hypothetical protein